MRTVIVIYFLISAVCFGQMPAEDPFSVVNPIPAALPLPEPPSAAASSFAEDQERRKELATASRENAPGYLKPLSHWAGPLADRKQKQTVEQEIIRQTGYDRVSNKVYHSEPVFDWEKEDEKKKFDWSVLDPVNFAAKFRDMAGLGPDEAKAAESLKKGREILQSNPELKDQKKCLEAAKHFTEAAKRAPDSLIEEDALHLAGECYFFADDYPNAMAMYQKLVIKYRHSKYVDSDVRRLFKIAQYWESEFEKGKTGLHFGDKSLPNYDTFGYAKKTYETIFLNDPNGPVSDDALMALATAYLKRGKYQGDDNFNQAAFYYQRLREDYPLSKHLANAYKNELYARTRAYMGAEHPSKSLEEAAKLADMTLQQFNKELPAQEKQDVLGLKEDILTNKAEQLWAMGQFYDIKKRHYGSAKLYYEKLTAEYPQTKFAEMARIRMEQIKGLPDVPPIIGFPVNPFKRTDRDIQVRETPQPVR
ncbi:MAG: tetratricopeptide repeat protein [Planctomycetaceae bacterium]|jgi:tetratricopeptide (TPR) repeat protein|nr:tetratricopeptide repeat protein [Planctomycetaceae bacterium]